MRVYIVTTGEQKTYSIRAVTNDIEKAKEYCEIFSDESSHAVIETYETDNIGFEYTPGMMLYEVALKATTNQGIKMCCERVSISTINEGNLKINKVYLLYDQSAGYIPGYYVYIEAKSQEDALKEGSNLIYTHIDNNTEEYNKFKSQNDIKNGDI